MIRRTTIACIIAALIGLLSVSFLLPDSTKASSSDTASITKTDAPPEPGAPDSPEVIEVPEAVEKTPEAATPAVEASALAALSVPSSAPTTDPIERPLLASRGADQIKDYQALRAKLTQYLASQEGHYAVYFQDLNTGRGFGINENDPMAAASTIKIPVVLYLYNEAAAGRINLNERVTYTAADQEAGAGTIYYNHKLGATFSLADLADKALTLSDNVAVNMMIRRLGMNKINAYCRQLGANVMWNGANVTSARSMGIYLKGITDLAKRSALGQKMLDQMTDTQPHDRIMAGVPSSIKVAHKHGNNHGVINDVGIVFLSGRPYIITLLSEDIDYFGAPAILAKVSKMAYEYQAAG